MNFRRIPAFLALLAVLTGSVSSVSARAQIVDAESIPEYVSLYLESVRGGHDWEAAAYRSRIQRRVFSLHGDAYENALRLIDREASRNPGAIHELALYLQRHWEARHASAISCTTIGHTTHGARVGALVGLSALGVALFYRPAAIPKYFNLVRGFLPAIGVNIGARAGTRFSSHSHVPKAPAQVMRLGMPEDFREMNEDAIIAETVSLVRQIAIGTTTYALVNSRLFQALKVVKTLNRLATPAKVNLVVLVASTALSFAAEKTVETVLDHKEIMTRRHSIGNAVENLSRRLADSGADEAYTAAHEFTRAIIGFSRYLNQPVMDRIREFESKTLSIREKHGESVKAERKIADAERDFQRDMTKLLYQLDRKAGAAYNTSTDYLLMTARQSDIRWLARQLRDGNIPDHPRYVLLQGAAYLKSLRRDWLDSHADLLLSLLQSQVSLSCEAGVGGATHVSGELLR